MCLRNNKFFILLFWLYSISNAADTCHPEIGDNDYVIGYGSLMSQSSAERTVGKIKERHPVNVTGFKRSFGLLTNFYNLKTAFLSVKNSTDHKMNGVMMKLTKNDVLNLDKREIGYCRLSIERKNIEFLDQFNFSNQEVNVWIYVLNDQKTVKEDDSYYLAQSYIDEFLGGCLEVNDEFSLSDFADNCVKLTSDWDSKVISNDRIYPRRPIYEQPKAWIIDELLQNIVPIAIEHRVLE